MYRTHTKFPKYQLQIEEYRHGLVRLRSNRKWTLYKTIIGFNKRFTRSRHGGNFIHLWNHRTNKGVIYSMEQRKIIARGDRKLNYILGCRLRVPMRLMMFNFHLIIVNGTCVTLTTDIGVAHFEGKYDLYLGDLKRMFVGKDHGWITNLDKLGEVDIEIS